MTDAPTPFTPGEVPAAAPSSRGVHLADGEWHRMHPLTPLLKGGIVIVALAAFVLSNLQDRIIRFFVELFAPDVPDSADYNGGDPVDWVLNNNFVLVVLAGVLVLLIVVTAIFYVSWRFNEFRITDANVEIRKGLIFRSQRRAPLDRVQGVNLTRPFPARLIGLGKLEVVGAGTDANVDLSYLNIAKAEAVRADILRLASGARAATARAREGIATPTDAGAAAPAAGGIRQELIGSMTSGVSGLIEGVDTYDVPPEHVMRIPTGRLIGAHSLGAVLMLVLFLAILAVVVGTTLIAAIADGEEDIGMIAGMVALFSGIPLVLTLGGMTVSRIMRGLRYSIAPTPDGLRITSGLLTTVTETLPPGRIFAVEVSQPFLWKPFGWWAVRINRMSGASAAAQGTNSQQQQQQHMVLPVGRREDVEWVLRVILPSVPDDEFATIWQHGILGPVEGDPYKTIPKRARWRRPISWKRHGYALTSDAVLLRRGVLWRNLAIFPLARLQGVSVAQGPVARAQRTAAGRLHSAVGPVLGGVTGLERDDALALVNGVSVAAARAAADDKAHRWAANEQSMSAIPPAPTARPQAAMPPAPGGYAGVPVAPYAPGPAAAPVMPAPNAAPAGVPDAAPAAPGPAMPTVPLAPPLGAPPAPPVAPVAAPPVQPPAPPAAPPVVPPVAPPAPAAPPAPPVVPPPAPPAPPVVPPAAPPAPPAAPPTDQA